jgi:hypothetical protein
MFYLMDSDTFLLLRKAGHDGADWVADKNGALCWDTYDLANETSKNLELLGWVPGKLLVVSFSGAV